VKNHRLPLRTVVQVLLTEQLRLRRFVTDYLLLSNENPDHEHQQAGLGLNRDIDSMRARVDGLEKECGVIHADVERLECSTSCQGFRLGAGFASCGKMNDAVGSSTERT
jgi:hypothetical protein